ncbi:lipase family protein [Heyndrickxia faecalis]|uniref:lipase family protein n=1 Tax=Heyndrickxia faecalis TaxID=2824910 RepID=UPI003D1FB4E5
MATDTDSKIYKLSSDEGKLLLAGEFIYEYENKKKQYVKNRIIKRFNSQIIKKSIDLKTGFSGYALKDNETGEIVIVYVGTQLKQKGKGDLKADGEIGVYNLAGWKLDVKQVKQANDFYHQVKKENKGAKISLTGHSLGGGLANSVAMRNKDDQIDVLSLNPAPLLARDIQKYGNGFDQKNIRNVINECDPLHIGVEDADMVIPGQMYIIPNGKGHSLDFNESDFDKDGNLIWFKKLKNHNDTGLDWYPGFMELAVSSGAIYKGLTDKDFGYKEEAVVAGVTSEFPGMVGNLSVVVFGLMSLGDYSAVKIEAEHYLYVGVTETISFVEGVASDIKKEVEMTMEAIEISLLLIMKKVIDTALDTAFHMAFQMFKDGLLIYLTVSDIKAILMEVGYSVVKDIKDLFKGDFDIDTDVKQIVINHVVSRYNAMKRLFKEDLKKGIDKALMNEINKDIKQLSKDIKQLGNDVNTAVISMVETDEELKNTMFRSMVG